jgi:hypothetical protein
LQNSKFSIKWYQIYNDEFGEYKHAAEKEKTGEYVSPMHG